MKYKFWKDNRLDKEFSLTIEELEREYLKFLKEKPVNWLHHYGDATVRYFVSYTEGLNSVTDESTFEAIYEPLRRVRHEYLKSIGRYVK